MDSKAQLAAQVILAGTNMQIDEATKLFGILIRSLYNTSTLREKLSEEVISLNETLITKMIELNSTRTAIVLASLNLAKTMIEMIGEDVSASKETEKKP